MLECGRKEDDDSPRNANPNRLAVYLVSGLCPMRGAVKQKPRRVRAGLWKSVLAETSTSSF